MISDTIIREHIRDLINDLRVYLAEEGVDIAQRREITRWAINQYKNRVKDFNTCENWNTGNQDIHTHFDKIMVSVEIEAVQIAKDLKAAAKKEHRRMVTGLLKKALLLSFFVYMMLLAALIF